MFSAVVLTDCVATADVHNDKQVSEESDDNNDEEVFGTNHVAEGSGRFVHPEPRGTEPRARPKTRTKSTHVVTDR